jgi:hypothetical protein
MNLRSQGLVGKREVELQEQINFYNNELTNLKDLKAMVGFPLTIPP